MKEAKGNVYRVRWRDACSINGWHTDRPEEDKDDIIESVGFFLRMNKHYWIMYQSFSTWGSVSETLAIPKVSIVSKEELK